TAELSRNRTMKPSELRRRVLALFDEHARFKHLLEHHDGAERSGFMAALDRGASPDVRRSLLDRSLSEWHERRGLLYPVLERARALTQG
ncbi:MAG TPA: hypothetical protein VFQ61_32265, partial [Polyangiaceae bacterium]|nr:hypothetical protein [Polyangiaceae bacterium]